MPLSNLSTGSYFYPLMQKPYAGSIAQPVSFIFSSTFTGDTNNIIFSSTDVSRWKNINVTILNNSVHNLKSGTIEFSPNEVNWEGYHSATLSPLTSSGMVSYQMTGISKQYMRVRGHTSGSGGALTGSTAVFVSCNN